MKIVLDMTDPRSVWSMPAWVPERIAEALGGEGELVRIEAPADGSGDGAARADDAALEAVRDADAYLGFGIAAEILDAGERLGWVHSGAAGVGGSLHDAMRASSVVFTNSAGIHAEPMAETVLAYLLHFARGLDVAVRRQAEGRWDTGPFYAADTPVRELGASTVGVVGFGGVGRAVARKAAALGARVVGHRNRPQPEGAPTDGAARVGHTRSDLEALLGASHYVVLTVPETGETRGMVDGDFLERMRPGSVLVNVSRGGVVDHDALVAALREGRLRGAALDVSDPEPLPPGHPLWELPGVLVTPHVSAVTRRYWERETALILENLRALRDGRPLRNVVDRDAGY